MCVLRISSVDNVNCVTLEFNVTVLCSPGICWQVISALLIYFALLCHVNRGGHRPTVVFENREKLEKLQPPSWKDNAGGGRKMRQKARKKLRRQRDPLSCEWLEREQVVQQWNKQVGEHLRSKWDLFSDEWSQQIHVK